MQFNHGTSQLYTACLNGIGLVDLYDGMDPLAAAGIGGAYCKVWIWSHTSCYLTCVKFVINNCEAFDIMAGKLLMPLDYAQHIMQPSSSSIWLTGYFITQTRMARYVMESVCQRPSAACVASL
jgi:opacity protein-like surface antigen